MCYVVYLSTTSPEDLSARRVDGFVFDRDVDDDAGSRALRFPNRWRAGDPSGGCSCHFRHLLDEGFGFRGPEEWIPEDPEDLASTLDFAAAVRDMVRRGFEEFRFFENWHFVFEGGREAG